MHKCSPEFDTFDGELVPKLRLCGRDGAGTESKYHATSAIALGER